MPKRSSKKTMSYGINPAAKSVVDQATSNGAAVDDGDGKNPAAVALGRLGGLKGGKARAKALTKEERSKIAKKAARVRWAGVKRKGH
ncbi:MAG: hypothetical protein WD648_03565 [Planctomycetaceae bacterium]